MFDKILKILATGEPLSLKEISNRANSSQEMVLQALSDLLGMGYLERRVVEEDPTCESGCGGCSGCAVTLGADAVRLNITEKGVGKLKRAEKKID